MNAPAHTTEVALFTECYHPIINGVVASIDALRAGLQAAGAGVAIVAPHFPRRRGDDEAIVRLPSLPLPTSTGYRLCVPYLPRSVRELLRGATVVHAHSPFVTGRLGANFARRSGLPLVFTYHTRIDEYAHYAPFEPRLARAAMTHVTRAFANGADAVIVPTDAMRSRLREIGVRVRIAVIPSAIDVERFTNARRSTAARAALGVRDGARVVLAVSRVAREKQLEVAIDALAHVRDTCLAIVGDGPARAQLEARANASGVSDRVYFAGALEPAALPDIYASCDAFAFTSATETQGLVLAEALASGLPVVAVDTAVNREVLGGFARLVAPDPAAFGNALDDALAAPRDPAAAAYARNVFGRTRHAEAVLDLYNSLSLCRTFGTLVRDYAPGSHTYR